MKIPPLEAVINGGNFLLVLCAFTREAATYEE